MKKKYFNYLICFLIIIFLIEIFKSSSLIINTIYKSTSIWYYNLVPTILPIYIIVDLLSNYNGFYYIRR